MTESKTLMLVLLIIVSLGFVLVAIQLGNLNKSMGSLVEKQESTQKMIAYKLSITEYIQNARLAGYDDKTIYFFLKGKRSEDIELNSDLPLNCVNHIDPNHHQPECFVKLLPVVRK